MTDVIVRVPRKEEAHFWEEPPKGNLEYWKLGTPPTQFLNGDRVYFALGDSIVAQARFAWRSEGNLESEDGRTWKGHFLVWAAKDFVKLPKPVPLSALNLKVPRGFAYVGGTALRALLAKEGL